MAQSDAVLERARDAAGGKLWDKVATLVYEGGEDSSGMKVRFHVAEDVTTGRMRRESV